MQTSKDDRASKKKVANRFFLAGLALLAGASIIYLFS